jgi:hypothetical protein
LASFERKGLYCALLTLATNLLSNHLLNFVCCSTLNSAHDPELCHTTLKVVTCKRETDRFIDHTAHPELCHTPPNINCRTLPANMKQIDRSITQDWSKIKSEFSLANQAALFAWRTLGFCFRQDVFHLRSAIGILFTIHDIQILLRLKPGHTSNTIHLGFAGVSFPHGYRHELCRTHGRQKSVKQTMRWLQRFNCVIC